MKELNRFQHVLILFGGFICYLLADGYTYSIGIIYSRILSSFDEGGMQTALLPGLLYSVPQFSAIFLCPLLDTYGYSSGAAWGALLLCSSCIASSVVNSLHWLYFTLGVVTSVGLQLTYTSAIMAVTNTFKDNNFFGLAVGFTMCGSGVGSTLSSPFIAWLLDRWTLSHVLIIEGGILLHVLISSSCFHHLDAVRFRRSVKFISTTDPGDLVQSSTFSLTPPSACTNSMDECSGVQLRSRLESVKECVKSFVRFILCVPSRYRFHADSLKTNDVSKSSDVSEFQHFTAVAIVTEQDDSSGYSFRQVLTVLGASLKRLISPQLWKNPTFLVYVFANALTGAGIVIPWTFMYDYAFISLPNLDEASTLEISWLPSMIGFGSLFGQITIGLLTSQFGNIWHSFHCCRRCNKDESIVDLEQPETNNSIANRVTCHLSCTSADRHLYLFMFVLLWNGVTTLILAFIPIQSLSSQLSAQNTFFTLPLGILSAVVCFLLGMSNGGIYVLYPVILIDTVGEVLWPAALAFYLMLNGAMNLIGTTIGGHVFDVTGSYHDAFIAASCFPLVGFVVCAIQQLIVHFLPSPQQPTEPQTMECSN